MGELGLKSEEEDDGTEQLSQWEESLTLKIHSLIVEFGKGLSWTKSAH